jgi:hypothetical protein
MSSHKNHDKLETIKDAIDKVGLNALGLDTTTTVDCYFANKSFAGQGTGNRRFYDNTGATKISINSGFVYLDTITAPAGGSATAGFQVIASGETDAVGFTVSLNQTVTDVTGGCLDHVYVVGPLSDTSGAQLPLTSWTYNSGISVEYNYANGIPQPRGVAIQAYEQVITIESNDKEFYDTLVNDDEIIGCITDYSLFLRKTDLCQSRVPELTAEHIELGIPSATI